MGQAGRGLTGRRKTGKMGEIGQDGMGRREVGGRAGKGWAGMMVGGGRGGWSEAE